jgi:hypothetical protein
MNFFLPLTLMLAVLLAAGCASGKPKPALKPAAETKAAAAPAVLEPIVTPDNSLSGKVASYNSVGRFAVLSFPLGKLPKLEQTLFLYRGGLKVGEVKITGPQNDNNIVADLVSGDTQVGDDVRDQ